MSVEEYIRGLADKELQTEIYRRNKKKADAEHARQVEKWRLEREAEEAKDREFAERAGITYAQFQQVADYMIDKENY